MQAWIWILVYYQLALCKFLCLAFSFCLGRIEKDNYLWLWESYERKHAKCVAYLRHTMNDGWTFFLVKVLHDMPIYFCNLSIPLLRNVHQSGRSILPTSCPKCPSSFIIDILYQLCSNATRPSKLCNIISLFSKPSLLPSYLIFLCESHSILALPNSVHMDMTYHIPLCHNPWYKCYFI